MRAVLSLASILAFSACAQAAPPASDSAPAMPQLSASDTIEMCLYRERGEGDPARCVFEYASNCIDLSGDLPTAAIRESCYEAEAEAWSSRMSASLDVLMPAISGERRDVLMQAQQAWVQSTVRDCDFVGSFHPHEPLANAQAAQCRTERTAERALLLRNWVESYSR
ncbi:lysozyme inhibitor LprI family protein [Maricaulis parjimensis]|uniref:lysozyme inhibitor LprI family protein n=1 Tax=Maricaulis parjimensis TaxID=144023 RepID=UPI001939FEA7|nr:lysozyme inhibitor LprI family protein [Maricaulis parjimensis]